MQAFVLCYHKVGPKRDEGRRLNIAPERLQSHAAFFKRRGYVFSLARDLGGAWKPRTVCFSFDDAYWSTMEYGVPVLDALGVPCTVYAVPSLVGHSSTWDPASPRPLARWDSLIDAQKRGHEIGNHTLSHPRMSALSPEEQFEQVAAADRALRANGLNPGSFCYPYGAYDAATLEAVRRAGYGVGLALNKRLAQDADDRLAISRIVIGFSDALPMLLYKLFLKPKLK
jgi:peptidoglycan/xylan/chitin deacetylase (PgdA/CDA1 family)